MTMEVQGEVNDYVGKGIHGGSIVVRPPAASKFAPEDNVIVGNTGTLPNLLVFAGTKEQLLTAEEMRQRSMARVNSVYLLC